MASKPVKKASATDNPYATGNKVPAPKKAAKKANKGMKGGK